MNLIVGLTEYLSNHVPSLAPSFQTLYVGSLPRLANISKSFFFISPPLSYVLKAYEEFFGMLTICSSKDVLRHDGCGYFWDIMTLAVLSLLRVSLETSATVDMP